MRWAVIDRKTAIVKEIVESDEPPRVDRNEQVVKGHCESCAVGKRFDGWTFHEVEK